ncbi:MSHA biogenesis protein MshC [Colwellia sp. 75C3]|uniref:prepilin-type N-terminal cleavage/methylation domain-containing protein n=1 Tax=Colwellia sp. 75C3 TaxID=888425 RepID=UPI000C348085|nr:prepilin-type N-terminal cleavage/methylation domain-containing protein [Colwellia sp. 75C3]PKG85259.1 MSHA biogenesis protein MshC [Colwellia sp. 75C3]
MNNKGFTLIELIVVIIIIGILAVTVAPKFDGTASYEAHSHRAQLISALRLTQQRAMQQTDTTDDYCHQIVFDVVEGVNLYGIPDRVDCDNITFPTPIKDWEPDATGHKVDEDYLISYNVDGQINPKRVGFDWMGRPLYDCNGGCTINILRPSETTLTITIESEGYIHAFDAP